MHSATCRLALAFCVVASVLLATGCATVTRGTTQPWTIDSLPSGAVASLSNGERCETPCSLTVKRKYPFNVEVCKPGFRTVNTSVVSGISGAGATGMAGNVILGGLVGLGVDAASGATKDLTPNPLVVNLTEDQEGCSTPAFPAVPQGGQTAEEYAKQRRKS
jgi:hypothetical protein